SKRVKPGGSLLYCVCSLLPEEGERQAKSFLASHPEFSQQAVDTGLLGGQSQFINAEGNLRTLPSMTIGGRQGLDGFFAAHLVRR
ncbi:MAG: SAM-dependent methyltransferase, partial [Novosphingobium sp.]